LSGEPAWLRAALDDCAACCVNDTEDRERLASAIMARLTALTHQMATCVYTAASAHHRTRAIRDDGGEIATQIARNAAQAILLLLENE
jgi:hypothetical protein